MEGKEAVDICLTLIKYITPLAALVWAIAHKDAQIKQNTSDIKKMKDNLVKDFAALQKVTIHDDKLKKIEKDLEDERNARIKLTESVSEIKIDVKAVATKMDLLLEMAKMGHLKNETKK